MARVARIAGALLAETGERYFLIGNTKEPCDFAAAGFEAPVEIDALKRPYLELSRCGSVELSPPWLSMAQEGEALAKLLSRRFLIERNGSVSERLWNLVVNPECPENGPAEQEIRAAWLAQMPDPFWQIVREAVLRCS